MKTPANEPANVLDTFHTNLWFVSIRLPNEVV